MRRTVDAAVTVVDHIYDSKLNLMLLENLQNTFAVGNSLVHLLLCSIPAHPTADIATNGFNNKEEDRIYVSNLLFLYVLTLRIVNIITILSRRRKKKERGALTIAGRNKRAIEQFFYSFSFENVFFMFFMFRRFFRGMMKCF